MQDSDHSSLEARAARRVARKMGFFIHALVYVLVNAGLYASQLVNGGHHGHAFPLLGWGLGLAIHGIVTLVALSGDGLREGLLAREIEILKRRSM